MAVDETNPLGLTLNVDPAGGTSYSAVGAITAIKSPTTETEVYEYRYMNEVDGWLRRLPMGKSAGPMTLTVNHDSNDSTHASLQTLHNSEAIARWQVIHTDSGAEVRTFLGFVSSVEPITEAGTPNQRTFTIMPDGAVTVI
ncbi:MAG: hypothetical protein H6637_05465 [Ardenticatenales bacterium]|nr:hypothetical protein [Ardenticatenales bacterium]